MPRGWVSSGARSAPMLLRHIGRQRARSSSSWRNQASFKSTVGCRFGPCWLSRSPERTVLALQAFALPNSSSRTHHLSCLSWGWRPWLSTTFTAHHHRPDSCVVSLAIEMAANLIGRRQVSLESQGCRVYPSYLKRLIADSTRCAAVVCCFSRTDLWRSRHAVRVPVPWEDLMAPFARPFG
jgi:hypothetical protein